MGESIIRRQAHMSVSGLASSMPISLKNR